MALADIDRQAETSKNATPVKAKLCRTELGADQKTGSRHDLFRIKMNW